MIRDPRDRVYADPGGDSVGSYEAGWPVSGETYEETPPGQLLGAMGGLESGTARSAGCGRCRGGGPAQSGSPETRRVMLSRPRSMPVAALPVPGYTFGTP